jgi:branched-chain amino acid transport system permease protein
MSLETLAQALIFGIFVGALYGLAAAGLSLVFGVMKMLNIAHGELLMLGGYSSFWLFSLYRIDPSPSLVLSAAILFLLGIVLYKGLFSRLIRFREEIKLNNSLLIGFGLILIFQNLAILLWTADERTITTSYAGWGVEMFDLRFPYVRLGGLAVALVVILSLHLFLNKTYFGKSIRATAEDWEAATLMGINIDRAYMVSFALGAALAAIAGTLVSVGYAIHPAMGLEWTLKALIVIVMAGMGSIWGAFIAGEILGAVESISAIFIGPYFEVVGLVIFLLVLMLRPQGLFGKGERGF